MRTEQEPKNTAGREAGLDSAYLGEIEVGDDLIAFGRVDLDGDVLSGE